MSFRSDPVKILAVGIAVRWFGISFYTPFILVYLHAILGVPLAWAGLEIAVVNLAALPVPILGGGIADRFGRRRVVLLSLAAEAAGILGLAGAMWIASLPAVLSALFVVLAAGVIGSPATSAYVADSTDPTTRAKAFAWQRVGMNTGFTAGIAAGGVLLLFLAYWQMAAAAALVASSGVLFTLALLPATPHDVDLATRRDRSTAAAASPSAGDRLASVASVFLASLRSLGRDPTFLLFWFGTVLVWPLVFQFSYAVPTFAHLSLGVSYGIIGIALAVNGIIPAVSQVPMTRALTGRRLTHVGIAGIVAYIVAFLSLGALAIHAVATVAALFTVVAVMTVGENLLFCAGSTIPMNLAPKDERGAYSGAMSLGASVGGVIAPLLAGFALTFSSAPLLAWGLLSLPAFPAIIVFAAMARRLTAEQNRV